jgi:molybdate transport system substrate-binding protein
MRKTLLVAVLMTIVPLVFAASAGAAELKLFGGGHFQGSGKPLVEAFTKKTGIMASYTPGNTGGPALPKRLAAGEQMDVIVMTRDDLDNQLKAGVIMPGTVVDFARDRLGVAVQKGAPKPDISTPEKFRAALLAAKAVAMEDLTPDPAHLHRGMAMHQILTDYGILDQVSKKAVTIPGAAAGVGKADLVVWLRPELIAVPMLDMVGPVPTDLYTTLAVGILASAKDVSDAQAFSRFLTSADGAAVWSTTGLEALPK